MSKTAPIIFILLCLLGFNSVVAQEPTTREKQMLVEMNKVRQDPSGYIKEIKAFMERQDLDYNWKRTANELIRELKRTEPMDPLLFSEELYEAAKKHGKWMKRRDRFQHSDYNYGENLVAGYPEVKDAVIDLLIDHGIRNRGHRKNILNPKYKKAACYEIEGKVDGFPYNFVQEFTF